MKLFKLIISSVLIFTNVISHEVSFEEYLDKHNINDNYFMRKSIFMENTIKILNHNSNPKNKWKMKMNHFGHLTSDEFKRIYASGLIIPKKDFPKGKNKNEIQVKEKRLLTEIPKELNWTSKGAVTPVKNQGQCGSCWSFATTGALEGAYFVKYNQLISFSEQQLVSCDRVDQGCNGGLMFKAYEFIERNGGLCNEHDYPYTSSNGFRGWCKNTRCTKVPNSAPVKYTNVSHTEMSLLEAVLKQPVAIAIEADQESFQFYSDGVLDTNCGTNLDHGVLLVGYGTTSDTGQDYWLVKNSWGPNWGDNGYIKIARGTQNNGGGECGILLFPSFPEF